MLDYTEQQISILLHNIFKEELLEIKPVGNHHLKRHLVYEVTVEAGIKYIFKLYYKGKKRKREIATLNLLSNSKTRCSHIVQYGNLPDGSEWLITQCLEGEVLDTVIDKMTCEEKLKIYNQMGEELGKIHSLKTFEFFGDWNEQGESIRFIKDYIIAFRNSVSRTENEILKQNLPDRNLLMEVIDYIKENDDVLNIEIIPRLTHGDYDARNVLVSKNSDGYFLTGIIDFEGAMPWNAEEDLISLYYKVFLENADYREAFLKGYRMYIEELEGFDKRIYIYLVYFIIDNCSWAYWQASDYYKENIECLKKIKRRGIF